MNEMQFGNQIRQLLNQGLRLDAEQADARCAQRARARSRASAPSRRRALAWADNVLGAFGGWAGAVAALVGRRSRCW